MIANVIVPVVAVIGTLSILALAFATLGRSSRRQGGEQSIPFVTLSLFTKMKQLFVKLLLASLCLPNYILLLPHISQTQNLTATPCAVTPLPLNASPASTTQSAIRGGFMQTSSVLAL